MSYRVRRFSFPLSATGSGTQLEDICNEFFALNNFITPVGVTVNWKEGNRRAGRVILNLFYRIIGVRHWAKLFAGPDEATVAADVAAYFANNPLFCPVLMADLTSPSQKGEGVSVYVVYQAIRDLIRSARPGVYPNYAPQGGNVAIGDFGEFRKVDDFSAPPVTAMNLGLLAWPQGRPGILFSSVDGCPEGGGFKLGGVALCCGDSGSLATATLSYYPDCGCGGLILAGGGGAPPVTTPVSPPLTTPPTTTTRSTTPPVTTNTIPPPPPPSPPPTYPPTPPATTTPPVTYPPPPTLPAFFGFGDPIVPHANAYYSLTGETNDGVISIPNFNLHSMWSDGTKLYILAKGTIVPTYFRLFESSDAITWIEVENTGTGNIFLFSDVSTIFDKAVNRSLFFAEYTPTNGRNGYTSTGPATGYTVDTHGLVSGAMTDGAGIMGEIIGSSRSRLAKVSYPYQWTAPGINPPLLDPSYGAKTLEDLAYGNGVWVVMGYEVSGFAIPRRRMRNWVGADLATIAQNPNILPPPPGVDYEICRSLRFGNGVFLACTVGAVLTATPSTSSHILRSNDGLNWTRVFSTTVDYAQNEKTRLRYHDGLKRWLWSNPYETLYSDDDGDTWSVGASNLQYYAESARPIHVV